MGRWFRDGGMCGQSTGSTYTNAPWRAHVRMYARNLLLMRRPYAAGVCDSAPALATSTCTALAPASEPHPA